MSQSCMNGVWNNLLILFMSFQTLSYQTGRKIQTVNCSLSTEFVSDKLEMEDIVKFWSLTERERSEFKQIKSFALFIRIQKHVE